MTYTFKLLNNIQPLDNETHHCLLVGLIEMHRSTLEQLNTDLYICWAVELSIARYSGSVATICRGLDLAKMRVLCRYTFALNAGNMRARNIKNAGI